jgi:amino acid adenylation domain-containing protein
VSGSTSLQGFRLSPHQECLWRLGQEEGWVPYVVQGVLLIEGEGEPRTLWRALGDVVRRYEILRTTYQYLPGMTLPVQVIGEDAAVQIAEVNLRGLAESDQQERLRECFEEDRRSPFDLSRGPLLRARRLLVTETSCLLTLTLSSLCADAMSLANLVAEVSRACASAGDRGKPPVEAMQYADFSEWIHELSASDGASEGQDYWRRQTLPGGQAAKLPFERVSPVSHGFQPEAVPVAIALSTRQALQGLTGGDSAGWSKLLLACWQALLLRLTGEQEIVVRVAFDGRKYEELRGALGCFARHLPVVARVAAEERFDQLLGRTGEGLAEAARWQEYFDWSFVTETRDLPGWQICPISFELFDLRATSRSAGGLFRLEHINVCLDRFKLKLTCSLTGSGPSLRLEYDAGLFASCDAAVIARSLEALLDAVGRHPESLLTELDVLDSEERRRLLAELNQTWTDFPRDLCLHEIFELQVEKTPERLAVVEGGRSLSYAELNARANQLAWTLRRQGVGLEVPIAISSVRSLETLIGLLAILKAGANYLPVEPGHPRERLSQMFEDMHPRLFLCTDAAVEGFGDVPTLRIWLNDWKFGEESTGNPGKCAAPESLAYVLFTSGTTGRPKGVMVPHRGLVNYLTWCTRAYPVEHGWGAPVHSSIGFDLTVTSLFSPLFVGGAIWLLPEVSGNDSLGAALREHGGFSLVKLTPAHLEMLLPELEMSDPASCTRALVVGGEALRAEALAFWRERAPGTRLFNEYGPTETVVGCCVYEVRPEDPAQGPVPIGRPIANTSLYVLDERMQPVPAGIIGELYIGGEGVVRGYLARPELTAAVFLPDPFSDRAGSRLYRTGDLVRHLPGGHLEFIGRRDGQVKIRGYRIEIGEVEAALCQHPGIAEAVVLAREEERGERRLVAFFVPNGHPAPSSRQLAEFLRHRLLAWMIPSVWQEVESLPLTANGKIDRAALLMQPDGHHLRRRVTAPRTPTEELVASVWCEILGLEQVGRADDFLELGGHSLMATRVLSRLRKIFSVELPFRLLIEAPTVTRVAARIESELAKGRFVESPPIERVDRSGPLPLSFMQQRLWFLDRLAPGSPVYNIPGALLLEGDLDVGALRRTLGEVVRRHEPLRTTFRTEGGLPVQVIAPASPFVLPVIDLSALQEDGREALARRLATEEARDSFDLVRGPLLRAGLLRLSASTHLLLFTLHHIVFDGWSTGILVSEVAALYSAFRDGKASPLPELPVQYADFAQWQSRRLQGRVLDSLLAYWLARLAGPLPVLDLPADRPRPPVLGARGAAMSFSLSDELATSLRAFSRRNGATLFMTVLTVFDTLLARYTGIEDILVGTPVAGRERIETEQMIGLLINTLALRTDLAGDPSFGEALVRVRETALEAHAHQELPFERLVQELQPDRDPSRTPVFQVLFALQNSPVEPLRLGDLAATPLDIHTGTAKLDLALAMSELEGGLAVSIEYGTDLFDSATVARMTDHLRNLFAAAMAAPSGRLSELPLLGAADVHQLVHEWNTALTAGTAGGCIHHVFARRSLLAPDTLAVIAGAARLSYGELDRHAGRLARRLRALGIGPESRVGVCLERSATMLVGLLGILKAGGAYVPLDPAYPAERIAFMLQDSGAGLVVTERALAGRFGEDTALLLLDALDDEADFSSFLDEDGGAAEGNAAYVIYTSGSTGRPKGVVVTHGNVLRLFEATDAWFGFNASDVWTLFHSFAFDFSVWEVWGALLHGGRVVVVPYLVSRSPEAFYALILREGVTVLNQTPSAFRSLMQVVAEDETVVDLPLRWVIFGGEALEFTQLRPWMERFGTSRPCLVNMYGITETTVHVTWRPLTAGDPYGSVSSAIGQAIPDLSIRLLDPSGHPVPIGAKGELHVGGGGLARGYLGRPDLTAERFVPDPFGISGERLYRTGDLARYRPDGDLEFLGRIDHQVKIRGFRIELGEIETALAEHPELREVVIAGWKEASGETRLAAWVVPVRKPAPSAGELREFLKRRLPEYMLPSVFIPMSRLPVTPSGKVDRRSLPAPGAERLLPGSVFNAPSTPLEQALAETWAQVLGLERVGIDDNFFGLGGDSMRTLQVVSLAGERGMTIELRDLYGFQTVRELAAHLAGICELADRATHGRDEEEVLAELLGELDRLSDEEVQLRLSDSLQHNVEPVA